MHTMLPKVKYLLTYRYAEIIFDLAGEFCQRFYDPFKDKRTIDQIAGARRSGKQNIIEGEADAKASAKLHIKLLSTANGSFEELIGDFEDFLRERKLSRWEKSDSRVTNMRAYGYRLSNLKNLLASGDLIEKATLPVNPEEAANLLLTLCHMETYLLSKQIAAVEKKFIEEGGYTESLYRNRVEYRKK